MRGGGLRLLVVAGLLLIQGLIIGSGISPVLRHRMADGDSYMYLLRAERLVETGQLLDRTTRMNPPEGGGLHWTRPVDLLLIAGAAPLRLVLPWREALFVWGSALAPVLGLLSLLALFWTTAPLLGPRGQALAGLVFIVQKANIDIFLAGRPDHHGLVTLLVIVTLGAVLRCVAPRPRLQQPLLAGGATALAVWASVEALLPLAGPAAALALLWAARGGALARAGCLWFGSASLGAASALTFESLGRSGPQPALDSLSPTYVLLLAGAALGFGLLHVGGGRLRHAGARLGAVALCAAAAGVLVVALQPDLLGGPYGQIDGRLGPIWLNHVLENQSLWVAAGGGPALLALHALLPALCLVWGLWRLARGRLEPAWAVLVAGQAVTLLPMLLHLRLSGHAQVFAAPLAAALALAAAHRIGERLQPPWRLVAMTVPVLALVIGPAFSAAALHKPKAPTAEARGVRDNLPCEMSRVGPLLDRQPPRIVASLIFPAPELLYYSNATILAGPYHRLGPAIVDLVALFEAKDAATAQEIMRRRGVDTILVCLGDRELDRYAKPGTLAAQLQAGTPPAWLRPVPLPPGFETYGLFELGP